MKLLIRTLGILLGVSLAIAAQAQAYTRTDVVAYSDNTTKWVLGQVASSTNTNTGVIEFKTEYDPITALPIKHYGPGTAMVSGKLQQTLTYDTTSTIASGQLGTIKTIKDGNNNITTLSSWKRGIPQSIKYPITPESPTGAVQSAVVNDSGWITSVTDENGAGFTTNYQYDAMGRLSRIVYPTDDSTIWNDTVLTFVPVTVAEYGIPTGHWRQTVSTGNGKKITYFDALWRPIVVETYDAKDAPTIASTRSVSVTRYDEEGRPIFQSYPRNSLVSYTDASLTGMDTFYDALGRVTSVSQDSELGLLTTLTAYSSDATGPYTRTTNPRLVQTVTRYQMFDQPSYDFPVLIDQAQNLPERVGIDIARDVFGKPLSIRKRNSANTISLTRSYAYNANQELCRNVEPETGATLMGYDGAGNVTWSAAGLPAGTACHTTGLVSPIQERRAARTYDARNRVKTLGFPDGLGNTTSTYTADGLLASIAAQNGAHLVTTSYLYNKRRLPLSERMQWDSIDWPISYGYNPNGHLSSQSSPSGLSVAYAPNALGQPTQAGSYASGVSYYPNGAIKGFTYGNGIAYSMLQNSRQLPERSINCTVAGVGCVSSNKRLDLTYSFDEAGNVSGITDNMGGPQTRAMNYDGLDRLTQATSPMFGTASYGYNVLDNLTTLNVSGGSKARNHAYVYDATSNRLISATTGVGGAAVVGLGYDAQGNVNNKNGALYTFDYGNRLRSVGGAAAASSYVYDGHGHRVRDITTGSKYSLYNQGGQLVYTSDVRAAKRTNYVYLGGSLVAFSETPVAGGTATVKYQHTDALGTPITVTGSAKEIIETSQYEPYGQQINFEPMLPKDGPGYTGHVQDASSGLTYMQQRYFDSGIGRFLSVDPVTAQDGDYRHFNRYAYAYNNPYKFTDPDGRCPVCPFIAGFFIYLTADNANAPGPNDTPSSMPAGQQVASAIPGGGKVASGVRMGAKQADKTYTTYTREKTGAPTYSGHTSGKGTPEQQVAARTRSPDHQAKTAEGYGPARVDKNSPNADAISGREQRLIEQNGGAQSQGGTSANKINASSPSNPKHETRMEACKKEFGC